jgi:ribonuclease HII
MQDIESREQKRLLKISFHELRLRQYGYHLVAGVDEAGRGPLAGPVVAAACVLPPGFLLPYLNDSKQLSAEMRASLFEQLTNNPEVRYATGIVSVERIDEINILQASLEAMRLAIQNLKAQPDYLLIDGNQPLNLTIPGETLVKGDSLSISIAAASVIAKETRDRIMVDAAERWPEYGFEQHKGYATLQHLEALRRFGPCPLHRRSFEPIKTMNAYAGN